MSYYAINADSLFAFYQSLDPEDVHAEWVDLLPEHTGFACDIGAGSGRDAAWLAKKGWEVTAVEPCAPLRELGKAHTVQFTNTLRPHSLNKGSIIWLDDLLPDLNSLRALDQTFELILISAVWMHLRPNQQERSMQVINGLLAPGGLLVISLRHGPDETKRFHSVTAKTVIKYAQNHNLTSQRVISNVKDISRSSVHWDYLIFRAPFTRK